MKLTTSLSIFVVAYLGVCEAATTSTNSKIPAHFRIIEDNRIHPEKGVFSFDFKTENGIVREEAGNGDLVRTGVISYPLPNGEMFFLKFVADATGFKPESPFLPVAPVFPHPIPPHALEQIRRGEREHAEAARKRAEATNRIKRQQESQQHQQESQQRQQESQQRQQESQQRQQESQQIDRQLGGQEYVRQRRRQYRY